MKIKILKMFDEFRANCSSCPFHLERENIYSKTMARSTNAFDLHNALRKTKINYGY